MNIFYSVHIFSLDVEIQFVDLNTEHFLGNAIIN